MTADTPTPPADDAAMSAEEIVTIDFRYMLADRLRDLHKRAPEAITASGEIIDLFRPILSALTLRLQQAEAERDEAASIHSHMHRVAREEWAVRLRHEANGLLALLQQVREALKVAAGPYHPPPDPGAHSWQAWGTFWSLHARDVQRRAAATLAAIDAAMGGEKREEGQ